MKKLTVLDFLAQMLNKDLSKKEGYSAATLWLVTNEERKEKCLKLAQRMFDDWKNKELALQEEREELLSSIKVINIGVAK